jgi:hypothetical protein
MSNRSLDARLGSAAPEETRISITDEAAGVTPPIWHATQAKQK